MSPGSTLYFNGIDGERGGYARAPRTPKELAPFLAGFESPAVPKRVALGIDPDDLAQVGWGVVWPEGRSGERRRVLAPLLERRRGQAGKRFHEFEARDGESPLEFLERYGAGPGPVEPDIVPYHLLLAATPGEIPFAFQSELGISHAVGRLGFERPDEAAEHVRRLVAFEQGPAASPRQAAFFGVEHRDDPLTWWSAEHLVAGLEARVARAHRHWNVSTFLRRAADKPTLRRLLGGGPVPALLFTAGHGLSYGKASSRQATHQGALLCAEYPGPKAWSGAIPDHQLFAAHDLDADADLTGLVMCSFACYSAGTPRLDTYAGCEPVELADRPFVAPLARELLRRGALGVIGHVDLTFEQSFLWYSAGPQLAAFDSLLAAVLAGHALGGAMDFLAARYAQLAARVAAAVRQAQRLDAPVDVLRQLHTWAAYQDARNFVLLGDPAARLKV